jgi:hypothetical protein
MSEISRKKASNRYWFPAKRHGWGCGPPDTWKGWAALLVWLARSPSRRHF